MGNESFYETGFGVFYVYKFYENIALTTTFITVLSFLKETYMKY